IMRRLPDPSGPTPRRLDTTPGRHPPRPPIATYRESGHTIGPPAPAFPDLPRSAHRVDRQQIGAGLWFSPRRRSRCRTTPRWRNWQTRYLEVVVLATGWRFESSSGHSGPDATASV